MPKQLSFNWDKTPDQLQNPAPTSGNSLTTYKHDGQFPRSEGEFCYVERKFKESGAFSFSGNEKIKSIDDVAYIFRELENASIENAFAVLVNKGIPTVIHLGMGTFVSTQVNFAAIKAAYNAIGAEKIYFIHNHPSGEVLCSNEDRNVLHMIRRMFPPDIVQEGIIINTISGKYGTFDTYGHTNQYERPSFGNNIPLSLHSFDRLVFSPDYNLKNLSVIRNSGDVAALVSAQRLGSTKKISYLILDRGNKVIGNIHTTFQQIADNETSLAEEVADKVILFGGNQAILYGDFDFQGITKLKQEVERISGNTVDLTDVISIEGLHTKSAIDEMIMETIVDYNYNDVRFREVDMEYTDKERDIIERAKADDTYMKAPNGKPTNLDEHQWVQVRTEAFKKWFGDWENNPDSASKVLDENGEPRVVYHGTTNDKETRRWNEKMGWYDSTHEPFTIFKRKVDGLGNAGHFFNSDMDNAYGYGYNTYDTYLSLQNPLVIDCKGANYSSIDYNGETKDTYGWTEYAEKNGYDGVIFENVRDGVDYGDLATPTTDYVAFKSNQIKSATDNTGDFSRWNDDIRFRDIEDVNRKFNEELEKLTEENADNVVLSLGKPSDLLRSAGISDKPMKLYGNKVIKKMKKHGFSLSELRNLPEAAANPIAVFDNLGRKGNRSILTELRTEQGNFLVTIDLGKGKEDIDFNIVSSVFGKSDNKVVDWINKGYATYINKEKALDYLHHSAPIAEALSNSRLDSATNIVENFENPTLLDGKISSAIDTMSDELGVQVNRVKSRKDLPEGIQRQMKNGRYPGLFDPKTGEVYMVMDEITDVADAQATMLHEIVGHKGIRGLFGDRIGEFTSRVLDSMPTEERNKWVEKYKGNEQLAAEEYVAQFAEGYENPGIWEKIKAIFRDFLRDLGIDLKLRDNDLKYVLWKAKKTLGRENVVPKNKIVLFRKNKNIENPPHRSSKIKQKSVDFQNSI